MNLSDTYDRMAKDYYANRDRFPIGDILEFFRHNLNRLSGHLLDLGCGSGSPVCEHFLNHGWQVTGVDISEAMLTLARSHNPRGRFVHGDIRTFDFEPHRYDAISAVYSLFHLPVGDQNSLFAQAYQALKPGGKFLFTYASREYTGQDEFSGMIAFAGFELPYHHTTPEALRQTLSEVGFVVELDSKITKGGETFVWMLVARPV